ncbi:MAG: hypothetical protein IJC11_05085 [Alphaproteobacteria bacterium]|nr:hypothetical protein [Alphaproteobacteria bacterium]MBQ6853888.1 hypothetical protein [Alphaproteobacteria bacterium]
MSKMPRLLRKKSKKNTSETVISYHYRRAYLCWGLCVSTFICIAFLSLLSFVLSAQAACPAGEMALKQQNEKRAVSYFTRCALDRNEEDAQLWLAQYYQKQSQDDIGNVMKKLLFYHLAAENGNAHAQVALAKVLLKMDEADSSRAVLSSYLNQMAYAMETQNMLFKGEILHPYVLLVLAAENANQKWYYPTTNKTDGEAQVLLQNYEMDDEKKQELLKQGSQWKQRKMKESAQEVLSFAEYTDFIQTVYPEQGRADAFARQQAVANLKEKIDNYLKQ